MVTMKRLGKVRIEVRADHNPPHFHISSPHSDFMVYLNTFEVMRGTGRAEELKEALEWARANQAELARKWSEINEQE